MQLLPVFAGTITGIIVVILIRWSFEPDAIHYGMGGALVACAAIV
jgi:hypothetical protein